MFVQKHTINPSNNLTTEQKEFIRINSHRIVCIGDIDKNPRIIVKDRNVIDEFNRLAQQSSTLMKRSTSLIVINEPTPNTLLAQPTSQSFVIDDQSLILFFHAKHPLKQKLASHYEEKFSTKLKITKQRVRVVLSLTGTIENSKEALEDIKYLFSSVKHFRKGYSFIL